MLKINIPGYKKLQLEHLVLDHNGTLSCDGVLIKGVKQCLNNLANNIELHVITADTFGKAKAELLDVSCKLSILPLESQDFAKRNYIKELGSNKTVAIGNGRNDSLMLKEAELGIAVIQEEGAAAKAIMSANVICSNIINALDLLVHPLRLIATLRS
ncbi:ATPase P [Candidatus Magnetomoraceae bacterium gMMP-13]